MSKVKDQMCVICLEIIGVDRDGIWDGGHNALPVAKGRCCENCNETAVIPARMRALVDELGRKN